MSVANTVFAVFIWVVVSFLAYIPLLVLAMFCKLDPKVWVPRMLLIAALAGVLLTYGLEH